MSVKAMGLVWDLACPAEINGMVLGPNHKWVLMAYADHADHFGKNIYPAVKTVAAKTGLDERSVQRLTRDLEKMGLLVNDGIGPRGTRRWYIPFGQGGDRLSPWQSAGGDKSAKSLGDIPSGDIPSGDTVSPELKEPEPQKSISGYTDDDSVWAKIKAELLKEFSKASFETWIEPTWGKAFDGNTLIVAAANDYAREWLTSHITEKAQQTGGVFVEFVTANETGPA